MSEFDSNKYDAGDNIKRSSRVTVTAVAAIVLLALIFAFSGRSNKEYQTTVFAMDTVMNIKAYGPHAEEGIKLAVDEIYRLEKMFSVTDPDSEISRINQSTGEETEVSEECAKLINDSLKISRETDGALDISAYSLVHAWGFTTDNPDVPSAETIDAGRALADYRMIQVTDNNTVKTAPGQMIDLGAVTKGYAADRVAAVLKECGVRSAIINLGGNVVTIGRAPEGAWNIGIKDPFSDGELAGVVTITDKYKSVVTSGNYERYFEKEGVKYGHIIDPKTGYPADSGVASVTIITDNSTLADELSTACFVMGYERTEELRQKNKNFDYVILTSGGEIKVSDGVIFHQS